MRFRLGVCFVLAALLLGAATVALAFQGFSADVVSVSGNQTTHGKIFVAGDKMRLEKGGTTLITRLDQKVVWLLMPAQKMYMEQGFRPENIVPAPEATAGEAERTLLGKEAVNGRMANKYLVAVKMDGKRSSFLLWVASDAPLPLKTADEDGAWSQEYRNFAVEALDPAMFEIPAGYKNFAMSL
jgi:hypothetical protein